MDLLQKHGHLKHNREKSLAQREEAEQQYQKSQEGTSRLLSSPNTQAIGEFGANDAVI
ncbi:uncharacterized protein ACLA_055030 [Aspergillus clavatus NRRL 1]|uniref:Uncharacterized protein n=1 Tax=Aspergillus clavatus (strain ATCC 1007 / CBS 513.65 / DSM 816 / NCTC 3887 / NRRL 1 / QM 1276 / 107) TaxID=344612 RepID=A1C9D2_ASPCL|nr:uncharacterized protein ACLA_055030 [Aspergillus clavatus NRRL 1]EAW13456.1 conserved hypothetical protein [Aspergillus clavatus NRRL 1]